MEKEVREELLSWKKRNKLNKQQCDVLLECYRRSNTFRNGCLHSKLMYYGLPSDTNKCSEYITPTGVIVPKIINWFTLTTKGKFIITDLADKIVWNESMIYNLHIINSKIWTAHN